MFLAWVDCRLERLGRDRTVLTLAEEVLKAEFEEVKLCRAISGIVPGLFLGASIVESMSLVVAEECRNLSHGSRLK